MKLVAILLIIIVSFIGLAFLIYICAKYNYELKISSDKRKIEIRLYKNESHPNHR
jgi:hypothetical protein